MTARYGSEDGHLLPLELLEPYTKVVAEEHYNRVIVSMEKFGLLYPLVILQIDEDEWMEDVREQGNIVEPPGTWGEQVRHRIQCGNNRYWAIKEHYPEVTEVECLVYDNKPDAYEACRKIRGDKRWKNIR